jgi:hypothetical protein
MSCSRSHHGTNLARAVMCVVVLAGALLAPAPARAELLAYEGFAYDPGDLGTLNGGTGWSAAWARNGAGTASVVADSLTYTDTAGNALAVTGNHGFVSGQTANGDAHRDLAMRGDVDATTTWWSFIGQRLVPHATADENLIRASSLQIRNTVNTTPSVERLAVGKGTTGAPTVQQNWGMLHTGNAANSAVTSDPILEQAFLVVRIDHVGDVAVADNAWLWVNPRLDQTPDVSLADAALTGATTPASIDFSFNRIRAFAGNTNATGPYADFEFDEIRIGTAFADVAPIAGGGMDDADFDGDDDVDGNDLMRWQRGVGLTGQTTNANGDANGDGTVNGADLGVWKTQFGPGAVGAVTAIPEPATSALAGALAAVSSALATSRRGRPRRSPRGPSRA